MTRQRITLTLSPKALKLLDTFSKGSGLENRSRTIEEILFSLDQLEGYLHGLREEVEKYAKSETEARKYATNFNVRVSGVLDRFTRFLEVKVER